MTLREKIETMQAFERGEEIEISNNLGEIWIQEPCPNWNWVNCTYRIKPKPKQVVAIEKWLCKSIYNEYYIVEGFANQLRKYEGNKIKLLDIYEVEL